MNTSKEIISKISEIATKLNQFGARPDEKYTRIAIALPTDMLTRITVEDIKNKWKTGGPVFYLTNQKTHYNYYLLDPSIRDDYLRLEAMFKSSSAGFRNLAFFKPDIKMLKWLNLKYTLLEDYLKINAPEVIKYYKIVNSEILGKRAVPKNFIKNASPKRHNDGRSQNSQMDTTGGRKKK